METISDISKLYNCKIQVPADDHYLSEVISFVTNTLEIDSPKLKNNIAIIVEEAFVNVSHYSGSSFADVTVFKSDDCGYFLLEDEGTPFDPLNVKEDPYSELDMDRVGGLGILLIKQMSQGVFYEYKDNKNKLLVKLERD